MDCSYPEWILFDLGVGKAYYLPALKTKGVGIDFWEICFLLLGGEKMEKMIHRCDWEGWEDRCG